MLTCPHHHFLTSLRSTRDGGWERDNLLLRISCQPASILYLVVETTLERWGSESQPIHDCDRVLPLTDSNPKKSLDNQTKFSEMYGRLLSANLAVYGVVRPFKKLPGTPPRTLTLVTTRTLQCTPYPSSRHTTFLTGPFPLIDRTMTFATIAIL